MPPVAPNRLRRPAGSALLIAAAVSTLQADVVINEVHYDPEDVTRREEFVELHNTGAESVDLGGWTFSDGIAFTIPTGTMLAPGGFLVVAEDPAAFQSAFGTTALGPWSGQLSNRGESLELSDAGGRRVDRVGYAAGFPWPTRAKGGGSSMELVHPALDNDLGGSWRSSVPPGAFPELVLIGPSADGWRWRPGDTAPSVPDDAWTAPGFVEDATWSPAVLPIGYGGVGAIGSGDWGTAAEGMQGAYASFFLRHEFTIAEGEIPPRLLVRAIADDGVVVWVNGTEVARFNVPEGDLPLDTTADGSNLPEGEWVDIPLENAAAWLVEGVNTLAVRLFNDRVSSSDGGLDLQLIRPESGQDEPPRPTPGSANSVLADNPPPQIRQVAHSPAQPKAADDVAVTAKITDSDGVAEAVLEVQVVEPGNYVPAWRFVRANAPLEENPEYWDAGAWTDIPMRDDGTGGDAAAGDDVFTAVLPAALAGHRDLVRYRIRTVDGQGAVIRVPYEDDDQPNFACFVYDGVPSWQGSFTSTSAASTFPPEVMASVPPYHLIADPTDVTRCQYQGAYENSLFPGTLVFDGKVYDHVTFGIRGEFSTYQSGKNKWRFHFNRARDFEARDNYGRRFAADRRTLNLNACAAPWVPANRGLGGMEEAVSFRLHQLAGIPAPNTHYVQLRVVDDEAEASPTNQFEGDLWGLYLDVEYPDGRFLDARELPDGNVYKIEGGGNGTGDKKNQGPTQPVNSSDWTQFASTSARTNNDAGWWRENLDLDAYYSFRAINRAAGNVDIREGWNHYFYHRTDNRWVPIPWDLDMMFIPETHWSGTITQKNCLLIPELRTEFRNRCRELLDLLFDDRSATGGQFAQLVEEISSFINPAGAPLTFADVDAAMWNDNPRSINGHRRAFHRERVTDSRRGGSYVRTLVSGDHEGYVQFLKDFATDTDTDGWALGDGDQFGYGFEHLTSEARDTGVPDRPTLTFTGEPGFPADGIRVRSSAFSDPEGAATFATMRVRLGEISHPGLASHEPGTPWRYEIEPLWESGDLADPSEEVVVPAAYLRAGHLYRVRVRHLDETGRWSRWSEPVEFTATEPSTEPFLAGLVVSEVMFNPPPPTGDELAVSTDNEDFEFIELQNVGAVTLDLTNVRFTKGVDFDFGEEGSIHTLAPGDRLLVVGNRAAFEARYGAGLPVTGEWGDDRLANDGERIKLSLGAGIPIREFDYDDELPWPPAADGAGASLVLVAPDTVPDHAAPASWRPSAAGGGSPGVDKFVPFDGDPDADTNGNGVADLAEYGLVGDAPWDPPTMLVASGAAGLTHTVNLAADAILTVETSRDLETWIPAGAMLEVIDRRLEPGGLERLTWMPIPGTEPHEYYRVRVTLP